MGLGLSIINDKVGFEKNLSLNLDYSVTIRLDRYSNLSFGLRGGINFLSIDLSSIYQNHPDDPAFWGSDENAGLGHVGFGILYHTKEYYLGFSVPKVYEWELYIPNNAEATFESNKRHYYILAGAEIELNRELDIKPSTLLKYAVGSPVTVDITAQLVYNKKYYIGALYRTTNDIGLMAGLQITDEFELGYSYDWSTKFDLNQAFNDGSHEIFVRYTLGK